MRMWEELQDTKAEGKNEGKLLNKIELIREHMNDGCDISQLAYFLKETSDNIQLITDTILKNPQADDDDIWELIKEKWFSVN